MHQSLHPSPSLCLSLSRSPCLPSPPPPRCHYLPPKKVEEVHSILLFYVPGKFSPASPFSTLNSLSLCLCLSHSLSVNPPSLPEPSLHPSVPPDTSHSPPPLSPCQLTRPPPPPLSLSLSLCLSYNLAPWSLPHSDNWCVSAADASTLYLAAQH